MVSRQATSVSGWRPLSTPTLMKKYELPQAKARATKTIQRSAGEE